MSDVRTLVTFNFPLFRTAHLTIRRAPKFLRFTTANRGERTFDALDQLDDTPEPDEAVFAAERKSTGSAHVSRTEKGRRVGEWYQIAEYDLIKDGPDEVTMRDNEKWRAWCLERDHKRKAK